MCVLKVLSANAIGGGTGTVLVLVLVQAQARGTRLTRPRPRSPTRSKKHHHAIGASRRSSLTNHLPHKQHSDSSFRSLNSSTVVDNNIPTRNIIDQALEVMRNSLNDASLIAQQDQQEQSKESTGEDDAPTDNSNNNSSDNDNDEPTRADPEPPSYIGNLTAQPSFRKIAKKRRKAGGRSSFHHTKSRRGSLRRGAQETYQRLQLKTFNSNEKHH